MPASTETTMKVDRLSEVHSRWCSVLRLWSQETVFSKHETDNGRAMTLTRLTELRDKLNEIIAELNDEIEASTWLE